MLHPWVGASAPATLAAIKQSTKKMHIVETFEIDTSGDKPVRADWYRPFGAGVAGTAGAVVVLCHGFKGHRRWAFIPRLAEGLRSAGIAALAIDFSYNGICPPREARDAGEPTASGSESARTLYDPATFARNTIDRERRDLADVIAWLRRGKPDRSPPVSPAPIGLWGHSRGGIVALLNAYDDPTIKAVATWATPATPNFYTEKQKKRWRENGALVFRDAESGTELRVGTEYLDDLESHREEYALGERAGDLEVPHLIVHGELDLAFPIRDAWALYASGGHPAEKKIVCLRTGHTFGASGTGSTEALERAIDATVAWFETYLLGTKNKPAR